MIKHFTYKFTYCAPQCAIEEDYPSAALLAGSELTDDGAGDFLVPGEEFTL